MTNVQHDERRQRFHLTCDDDARGRLTVGIVSALFGLLLLPASDTDEGTWSREPGSGVGQGATGGR